MSDCCCGKDDCKPVELTEQMKECMKSMRVFSLATACDEGTPNVVPVGMLFPGEDGKIWIIDNFFDKTLHNMKENPLAAFYLWSPDYKEGCWQVKGTVEILDSGADYEKAVAIAHSRMETAPAKHLVKMTVCEVYSVAPGPDAGKKVL
ncbi:MAG: pyridoxamine 5'-phosphate oxidase family protein [Thermoplasmata archaeon]|nr:pyridoxamine 5'-phosphate oxidase family protein [Thermoplasmata archaeon]